ncbi:MAG: trypsin-like serine protease [Pseudomonadota bacterium]
MRSVRLWAAALILWPVGASADNTCEHAWDGYCDEPTGVCSAGTDTWDCRRTGPSPAADSCEFANDGECDETFSGGGPCMPYTDTTDCRAAGFDQSLPFKGTDDRTFVVPDHAPFDLIGRLDFANLASLCTASLIGPNTILTAAHCLYNDQGGDDLPTRFVLAPHGTTERAVTTVVDWYLPPGFEEALLGTEDKTDEDPLDWAIGWLAEPLGDTYGWLPVTAIGNRPLSDFGRDKGLEVMLPGYSGDAGAFMHVHRDCRILARFDDETLETDCDSLVGASGSPLLMQTRSGFAIIGVEIATYLSDGETMNVTNDALHFVSQVAVLPALRDRAAFEAHLVRLRGQD